MMSRKRGRNGQGGYSLTEMLVVVAMIGLFSLVTVPQFMNYYRQAKVRASVRQFNSHMRAARLRAITRNNPTAISFAAGTVPAGGFQSGQYGIFDRNVDTSTTPPTVSWQLVGNWYRLEQPVYFLPSDFATDAATDDDLNDVVFLSNGTVSNLPVSPDTPTLELKSAADVPNNHCTITVNLAGFFTSVMSTD